MTEATFSQLIIASDFCNAFIYKWVDRDHVDITRTCLPLTKPLRP
jgi:hypothetical protein